MSDKDLILQSLRNLEQAASVISNRDRHKGYYRKQGDWTRLERSIDEARRVLSSIDETAAATQTAAGKDGE